MSRAERPALWRDSPNCPDLLRDGAGASPHSPFYCSFFEDECRAIAARLLAGSAAAPGPSPDPADIGVPWSPSAGLVTSTPLESSPLPAAGSPPGSAFLSRSRGAPRRLVLPRASGCSRLARPQPRRVGRFPPGRLPARSPGRAAGKPSLARRASAGPEPRGAGKGPGAPATELPVPPGEPSPEGGARLAVRLQHGRSSPFPRRCQAEGDAGCQVQAAASHQRGLAAGTAVHRAQGFALGQSDGK